MKTAAVILAGGRSSRMGGGDKTLSPLGGKPILAHIIERLSGQVDLVAINANGVSARFADFDLPIIPDSAPDWPGPLAGILAAMEWAKENNLDRVITVSCDTPLLPLDLANRLQPASGEPIIVATSRGARHPVVASWPTAAAGALHEALIENGLRRVNSFIDAHDHLEVNFELVQTNFGLADPFANINTPEDLAMIERMFNGGKNEA